MAFTETDLEAFRETEKKELINKLMREYENMDIEGYSDSELNAIYNALAKVVSDYQDDVDIRYIPDFIQNAFDGMHNNFYEGITEGELIEFAIGH